MYLITFKRSALKELAGIPKPYKHHITTAIDALAENPRPDAVKKLKGDDKSYRVRAGDYRIIYCIEDIIKIVEIQRIRHRKDAYR